MMSNYPTPQRVWLRLAADKNQPALPEALRREIAAIVQAHDFGDGTFLWAIQFHWPTHDHMQAAIASGVAKLAKAATWTKRDDIPTTAINVEETVPDESKQPVDGALPVKVVSVATTIQARAAKYGFVGEAIKALVAPVEFESVEKVKVI